MKPDMSILRAFGAEAYVHVPKLKRRGKFGKRAVKGYLVGYAPGECYRIAIREGSYWSIVTSKDVDFDEKHQTKIFHQENHELNVEGESLEKEQTNTTPEENS